MDIDYSKALQGFDEIWRRVQQPKPQKSERPRPAPLKHKPSGRAKRFNPGR